MSRPVLLLDPDACRSAEAFAQVKPRLPVLRTTEDVKTAFARRPGAIWIALHTDLLLECLADLISGRRDHRLLVLEPLERARREILRGLFRSVVFSDKPWRLLSRGELAEVVSAPNAGDLVISGVVDREGGAMRLIRGNLDSFVVPLSAFTQAPDGPAPDLDSLEFTDHGQTIRLGEYEAAVDSLLYEYDRDYRRRQNAHRRAQDRTFGGALRRLRIQRGMGREDFADISAKEIARIERGEIKKPRAATLKKLAELLSVRPEEIADF